VRCKRLPPTVAMFRSCGEAPASKASERTGYRSRIPGCSASAVLLTSAPMVAPCGPTSIRRSSRPLMSRSQAGLITSIFTRSTTLVPPARRMVSACADACAASSSEDAVR